MTDQMNNPTVPAMDDTANAVPAEPTPMPLRRVFKIGAARVVEDASTEALSNEQVRDLLKGTYPEVANATIHEGIEGDTKIVSFLAQPGRKG